jgi:hypothetical protein
VPQHTLPILTSTPEDEQGFRDSIFASAAATWSDDVHADPRFAFELFHHFAHRPGLIVPVHANRHAAGAFDLVWWERAERVDDTRIATLEAVGQQVALLLRTPGGSARPSASARTRSSPSSATVVWVRMNAGAVRDGDEEYWEGIIEDITGQRRTDEAGRRPETCAPSPHWPTRRCTRSTTCRLELIRRRLDPAQHPRLDQAAGGLEAHRRHHRPHGPHHADGDPRRLRGVARARPAPVQRPARTLDDTVHPPHRKRASASTRYRASRPGAETGAKRALARLVLV